VKKLGEVKQKMTVYAGWEITSKWGSTTITNLQSMSFDGPGHDADAIYQGGSKVIQEIHERNLRPLTGSFVRRFDIHSNDWIIAATNTATLSYVDISIQHVTGTKLTVNSAIMTGYSYRYDVDGYAEETVDFMAKSLTPSAS